MKQRAGLLTPSEREELRAIPLFIGSGEGAGVLVVSRPYENVDDWVKAYSGLRLPESGEACRRSDSRSGRG